MELVISVRRAHRDSVPQDWVETVQATEGVTARGDATFGRLIVDATPDAYQQLEDMLGERFIIEPIQHYSTSRDTGGSGPDTPP